MILIVKWNLTYSKSYTCGRFVDFTKVIINCILCFNSIFEKINYWLTYPLALDPGAEIFSLFAVKEAGVTGNVIIDRTGKIIFLTRLYDRDEFERMKKVIFAGLAAK